MKVKEMNNKGKTKHLYQSELADMSMIKNTPEKAREHFKRKPYSVGKKEEKES